MRIVLFDFIFDQERPGISGLSDIVWNWARHLVAMGDRVHIVAPYPKSAQPPEGTFVHRFPVPPIGYRNIIGHVLIVLRGWLEIQKLGRVDIIQAPEYLSTGVFALLSRDTPVVLRVPGNIYERVAHGNPFDWSVTQVLKAAARVSARRCARIIVTSEDMRSWWAKTGAPESRMVLIPTGVDVELFRPIVNARTLLGIPRDRKVILYVGRLSHEKGIQHLLEALPAVDKDTPDVELHLVGDGKLRSHLLELAKKLQVEKRVTFHGWLDQPSLPMYYSAADVTVLPSFTEGLPRTMLEAMACGSPFLGTTITGVVDHVQDGETGFLVPPGDSNELAQKLRMVLKNATQAREIGERGREYVLRKLDWRVIVQRMRQEVYHRIGQD